uniref:Uncharacterized protein n=1 Tax=Meloidogyne enterolobii TaxID=390850 RepID=A0A6V7USZ3_MELEN|nr:unnamed protein product [Meloidogyne enterolobii]
MFTILLGTDDTLFAKLVDGNGKELFDYTPSAKFSINMLFKNETGNEQTIQRIADGDIFLNTNQSKINRFEFRTNLYDLACNINEHTEHSKKFKTQNNVCKFKSGDRNLLRDWNSANLSLCYESRLGEHIKNNPKSDYAKVCSNKGSGMHGIEFRAYATRVGFKIFEKEERYQVTFRFDVIIGFSYSEFTIKFGKEFNASGKYSNDGHLWLLDRNEINPLLLSITIGNNENKFAIITDEMNNIVYNYGRNILSNFEQKSLEEIVKEDGALGVVGPDMHLNGEYMDMNNFNIFLVTQKGCHIALNLTLNNEMMSKRYDCYKRPWNHCDLWGLEEYTKMKKALDELNEIMAECPCDYEERPPWIIDSWLRPDPESRNKRSVKDPSKLIKRDEDGYVSGCENATTPIAYGDVFVTLEQLLNDIEYYKKCCKKPLRSKRQLQNAPLSILLWEMPVYYDFTTEIFSKLIVRKYNFPLYSKSVFLFLNLNLASLALHI